MGDRAGLQAGLASRQAQAESAVVTVLYYITLNSKLSAHIVWSAEGIRGRFVGAGRTLAGFLLGGVLGWPWPWVWPWPWPWWPGSGPNPRPGPGPDGPGPGPDSAGPWAWPWTLAWPGLDPAAGPRFGPSSGPNPDPAPGFGPGSGPVP